jgi:hypothetical protein
LRCRELGNVPAMSDDEVRVSFTSRVSDLWRATVYVTIHGPRVAVFVLVPFVLGIIEVLAFNARGMRAILIFVVLFALIWGIFAISIYFHIRRNQQVLRPHDITFDRSAVVYTTADSETRYAWSAFNGVYFRPHGLVFVHQQRRAFVWIPLAALADTDAATLRRLIRSCSQ